MSGAPPEGPFWIQHSTLKNETYDASNPKDFYSHVLLEVAYNTSYDEAYYVRDINLPDHPRGGKQIFNHNTSTAYGRYENMTVMTGPSARSIRTVEQLRSYIGRSDLNRMCGHDKVTFIPVRMPSVDEKFLWVDLTFPLRGIYLPRVHIAHPKSQDWCIFSRVELRLRPAELKAYTKTRDEMTKKDFQILQDAIRTAEQFGAWGGQFLFHQAKPVPEPDLPDSYALELGKSGRIAAEFREETYRIEQNKTLGWSFQSDWTARFDIFRLLRVLLLPEHLLKDEYKNPYDAITLFNRDDIKVDMTNVPNRDMANSKIGFDITHLIKEEWGIAVEYKVTPCDPNFVLNLLQSIAQIGLNMIPMIGPLVAFGEQMIYDAITDPESFTTTQGLVGKLDKVVAAVVGTGVNTRDFLKEIKPVKLAVEGDEGRKPVFVGGDGEGQGVGGDEKKDDTAGEEPQVDPVIFDPEPQIKLLELTEYPEVTAIQAN